jgi:hypothetical protein
VEVIEGMKGNLGWVGIARPVYTAGVRYYYVFINPYHIKVTVPTPDIQNSTAIVS